MWYKCVEYYTLNICSMFQEAHVNTCYKHFYYFVSEYSLVDKKELEPLVSQYTSLGMTKPTKWPVHPAKTQISLSTHPVWVFVMHFISSQGPMPSSDGQLRLIRLGDAQADLKSLLSAQVISLFCCAPAHTKYKKPIKACPYYHKMQKLRHLIAVIFLYEPPHNKTNKMACAPSEDSAQPGHLPSLIRVFAVRMKKAWVISYPSSAQRRLWSDWADAQADLSLGWPDSHFVCFVMRWLIFV